MLKGGSGWFALVPQRVQGQKRKLQGDEERPSAIQEWSWKVRQDIDPVSLHLGGPYPDRPADFRSLCSQCHRPFRYFFAHHVKSSHPVRRSVYSPNTGLLGSSSPHGLYLGINRPFILTGQGPCYALWTSYFACCGITLSLYISSLLFISF